MELGNINILISVPHDGHLRPDDIQYRKVNDKGDLNTRMFAKVIQEELKQLFLAYQNSVIFPFIVFNNLNR